MVESMWPVAWWFSLAVSTDVASTDTPTMGGAETTWYPLVLNGSLELEHATRVQGCRWWVDALSGLMSGCLEVEDEFFQLGEFVSGDLCEGGIGGDKRVKDGLFIGDGKGHIVKMAL